MERKMVILLEAAHFRSMHDAEPLLGLVHP
jgi:hypothetical protein